MAPGYDTGHGVNGFAHTNAINEDNYNYQYGNYPNDATYPYQNTNNSYYQNPSQNENLNFYPPNNNAYYGGHQHPTDYYYNQWPDNQTGTNQYYGDYYNVDPNYVQNGNEYTQQPQQAYYGQSSNENQQQAHDNGEPADIKIPNFDIGIMNQNTN